MDPRNEAKLATPTAQQQNIDTSRKVGLWSCETKTVRVNPHITADHRDRGTCGQKGANIWILGDALGSLESLDRAR